ncbi:VWA domain-containing protein [Lysobacter xanthus]
MDVGPLHLLRPLWLLALLALPLFALLLRRRRAAGAPWERAIDPHLLPHLLEPGRTRRTRGRAALATVAYALAVIALAGPAWRQVDEPLWQTREPIVMAVDLSSATLAADLPPRRIDQLRARLTRLLQSHRTGPLALVAFADDAFTVAPLTDDAANVALFVDALEPSVMPVDGQSPARAIEWSRQLIERAGFPRGRIVLITDHADAEAQRAAVQARGAGMTVSALALGTSAGAEVRTPGGATVHVALDEDSLRDLARAGGGAYARLSLDGADEPVFASGTGDGVRRGEGGRTWADEGVRLVPLVMLLGLVLLARRAARAALLLLVVMLPRPAPAADLWLRPDQRAHHAVDRGIALYRKGDFDGAAKAFARSNDPDAHYDRGNALAKAGQLEDALAAYDAALRQRPGMADAVANRQAVMAALKRRQQGQQGQQSGKNGGASKSSQQSRNCAPGDAACDTSQQAPKSPPRAGEPSRTPSPPKPADASRQAQADAAQREAMRRAMQNAPGRQARVPADAKLSPAQREQRMSDEAALMRVPDDPGSLLREKFRLEQERRAGGGR